MKAFKQLNYLFDRKLKIRLVIIFIIMFIGSLAELLGVTAIFPIVDLAMNKEAIHENLVALVIARVIGTNSYTTIMLTLIIGIILVYVFKNLYLSWMTHKMNRFSKDTKRHFSKKLMTAYMKQSYEYFLNKNTSEILRSVQSDTTNLYGVITNLLQVISQGTTALLLIISLAITNLEMTILVAGFLGAGAVIIIFGVQKKMRKLGREFQKFSADMIKYAKQPFEGIKEVKIMNKEKYFVEQYVKTYDRAAGIEYISNFLSTVPKYLIETICITAIMMYLAGVIVLGGDLAELVPQLSVFAYASFRLLPSINSVYSNLSNIIYYRASIEVIYHDIKEVEDVKVDFEKEINQGVFDAFHDNIVLNDITFFYGNRGEMILENINVEIKKGEAIAFIGESGGGKTTLVDIMLGLLDPQKGNVLIDGNDIHNDVRAWHNRIGYIPQSIFLLDDSIRRNVAFGIEDDEIDDDKVWQALQKARLGDFVLKLENGLDTEVGEAGTRLSGGQRQRIGIARAMYYDPDILVFDEATSALDNETEKEVMEAVESFHGAKTMIIIAHRLTTIENCDHIYRVGEKKVQNVR